MTNSSHSLIRTSPPCDWAESENEPNSDRGVLEHPSPPAPATATYRVSGAFLDNDEVVSPQSTQSSLKPSIPHLAEANPTITVEHPSPTRPSNPEDGSGLVLTHDDFSSPGSIESSVEPTTPHLAEYDPTIKVELSSSAQATASEAMSGAYDQLHIECAVIPSQSCDKQRVPSLTRPMNFSPRCIRTIRIITAS